MTGDLFIPPASAPLTTIDVPPPPLYEEHVQQWTKVEIQPIQGHPYGTVLWCGYCVRVVINAISIGLYHESILDFIKSSLYYGDGTCNEIALPNIRIMATACPTAVNFLKNLSTDLFDKKVFTSHTTLTIKQDAVLTFTNNEDKAISHPLYKEDQVVLINKV